MRHLRWTLLLACSAAFSLASHAEAKALGTRAAPMARAGKAKPKAPAKRVVNAKSKKALGELMSTYKFGMSKDEVIVVLSKQLDAKYAEKLESTTDVYAQDQLRREKKKELTRLSSSWVTFDGKRTGWDVSLVEEEFAHDTGEAMLVQWENQDGKNQRRFFFFADGQLYKMFISLDTSVWPEETRNFAAFRQSMESRYGAGDVEDGKITWRAGEFEVRAVDKLRTYSALCLVIYNPAVTSGLEAKRKDKAAPPKKTSPIINAVIDDGNSQPDIKSNADTVEAVKNAK
ncbi:MAG: hypothetical protein IPI49_23920 [Myxococcales bacterium]|jgi:hypothetical protein|nr:hypothetical protein [Myxococcales bacterium]HRC56001.1 hypothetical protein [Kofleriaceae bacterium]